MSLVWSTTFAAWCEPAPLTLTDAIQLTLRSHPGVAADREDTIQRRAERRAASGAFDWVWFGESGYEVERSPLPQPNAIAVQREDSARLTLGAARQFRNGASVVPAATIVDNENNTNQTDPVSGADLGVQIRIPLLRGRGTEHAGADEFAAGFRAKAAEAAYRKNVERRIFATIASFWNCLAADRILDILADTEQRASEICDIVKRFVDGGELEYAVLAEAEGDYLRKRANTSTGKLDLYSRRQFLAAAIGMKPGESIRGPSVRGEFPEIDTVAPPNDSDRVRFVQLALSNRGDYLASRDQITALLVQLQKARNDLRPRLDLGLRVGFRGLDESEHSGRFYQSLSNNLTGLNTAVTLSMDWPYANNARKGEWYRQRSVLKEAEFRSQDLANSISSQVLITLETLVRSVEQYDFARASVELLASAIRNEKRKMVEGESNLTKINEIEDQHLDARIQEIEARVNFAIALLNLHNVTGTLLVEEPDGNLHFDRESLHAMPDSANANNGNY